ncbi:peptidoglycan-binding protein [Luteimonas deserti]|nr:peptidoglycan-binding protein [Luteimonas deserti]
MRNPLYDLMYQGESGAAGYNAFNRGTYIDASGRERIRAGQPPMDFSQLTVGELQDLQNKPRHDPDRVFAVGKYQIIPSTMNHALARLGLGREEPFTPALQDRIFSEYLLKEKQPAVRDYIMGVPGATLEQAQHGLAREWASFGDPLNGGQSHYGGANRAHITPAQSAAALDVLRERFAGAEARGLSRDAAWREATAVGNEAARDGDSVGLGHGRGTRIAALGPGSSGDTVQALQAQLHGLGYTGRNGSPLSVDGRFGPQTEHAVREFQRDQGLLDDGVAGRLTLEAVDRETQLSRNPGLNALFEALRNGPDALRGAVDALHSSSAGERWQKQLDAALAEPTNPTRCGPTPMQEGLARE